jgi:hypothetical protein
MAKARFLRQSPGQNLDGNFAVELGVFSAIHPTLPPAPSGREDFLVIERTRFSPPLAPVTYQHLYSLRPTRGQHFGISALS